jgi:rod shape-determining protein MreD
MTNTLFLNIFRFITLLAIQIVAFNNINFLGFISPFPYILFIILYPVNGNKSGLLLASFFLGLLLDIFSNSGGIHTTACLTLAYFRPVIFKFSFGVSYEYQTIKLNEVLTPERF